ncbi:MAG: DUF3426 domain-containing protein, partial [Enterobacterales bacterium]|nr:DUF3426 domain-containing protein [Enterobacterales bacterium]
FIVTDEHLALAAGKVRCGQCKSIFDATSFLFRDPEHDNGESTGAVAPEVPAEDFQGEEINDADLDNEEDGFEENKSYDDDDDFEDDGLDDDEDDDLEDDELDDDEDDEFEDDELDDDEDDDFEDDELDDDEDDDFEDDELDDDEDDDLEDDELDEDVDDNLKDDEQDEGDEENLEEKAPDSETIPILLVSDQNIEQQFTSDEALNARLDTELEADSEITSETTEIQPGKEPNITTQPDLSDDGVMISVASSAEYHHGVEAGLTDQSDPESEFKRALGGISLSESDPDKRAEEVANFVNGEQGRASWLPKLLWLFGSTLILLLIVASIFWFKRFELASNHNWRPVVDKLCQIVDCGIPAQRDISAIELRSREVTLNESDVTVNMILLNTATFVQPYPRIEVDFFDLDGNLITTKVMLPVEYLRVEFRKSLMPVAVPIYIEFDISIDTDEIVGYVFRFL